MDEERILEQREAPPAGPAPLEPPAPADDPAREETPAREEELARELSEARETIAELRARQNRAVMAYAIAQAVETSGTRDPEVLNWLLSREALQGEDGTPAGIREALEAQKRLRPWLFPEGGSRPVFAAETRSRPPEAEEPAIAKRYQGNPWYRRG